MKKGMALMLIFALLITGAFAFLTSQDSKTNTFTIGNVDIVLHEDNWYDDDGNLLDDEDDDGVPDWAEDLAPGQEVEKAPYVENVGSNDAWTFIVVSIPTADADTIANNNFTGKQKIDVTAYAFQDGYKDEVTAEAIWTAYGLDLDGDAEAATETDDRYEVFTMCKAGADDKPVLPGEDATYTINENFRQVGDVYMSDNGNNYYVFVYTGPENADTGVMLPAKDDPDTTNTDDFTNTLFDFVVLNSDIGDASFGVSNDGSADIEGSGFIGDGNNDDIFDDEEP